MQRHAISWRSRAAFLTATGNQSCRRRRFFEDCFEFRLSIGFSLNPNRFWIFF